MHWNPLKVFCYCVLHGDKRVCMCVYLIDWGTLRHIPLSTLLICEGIVRKINFCFSAWSHLEIKAVNTLWSIFPHMRGRYRHMLVVIEEWRVIIKRAPNWWYFGILFYTKISQNINGWLSITVGSRLAIQRITRCLKRRIARCDLLHLRIRQVQIQATDLMSR